MRRKIIGALRLDVASNDDTYRTKLREAFYNDVDPVLADAAFLENLTTVAALDASHSPFLSIGPNGIGTRYRRRHESAVKAVVSILLLVVVADDREARMIRFNDVRATMERIQGLARQLGDAMTRSSGSALAAEVVRL